MCVYVCVCLGSKGKGRRTDEEKDGRREGRTKRRTDEEKGKGRKNTQFGGKTHGSNIWRQKQQQFAREKSKHTTNEQNQHKELHCHTQHSTKQ